MSSKNTTGTPSGAEASDNITFTGTEETTETPTTGTAEETTETPTEASVVNAPYSVYGQYTKQYGVEPIVATFTISHWVGNTAYIRAKNAGFDGNYGFGDRPSIPLQLGSQYLEQFKNVGETGEIQVMFVPIYPSAIAAASDTPTVATASGTPPTFLNSQTLTQNG